MPRITGHRGKAERGKKEFHPESKRGNGPADILIWGFKLPNLSFACQVIHSLSHVWLYSVSYTIHVAIYLLHISDEFLESSAFVVIKFSKSLAIDL